MFETLELEPMAGAAAPAPAAPKTDVAVAASNAVDLSKVTLKDVALAKFGNWRAQVAEAEKAFVNVIYDLSTPGKLKEAKSRREALINQPRADARRVSKEVKSSMHQAGKEVTAEEEKAVAAFDVAEKAITSQIDAREAELEAERTAEIQRKSRHGGNVQRIRSYISMAQGLPSDRIDAGIAQLQAMTFGEDWEEYAGEAATARDETLAALRKLHTETLAEEARKAEEKRLAEARRLLGQLQDQVFGCMGKPSAYIAEQLDLLDNTTYAPDTDDGVLNAARAARGQLVSMLDLAKAQEMEAARQAERELEASLTAKFKAVEAGVATPNEQDAPAEKGNVPLPAAAGAYASTEPEAAQGSSSGDEGTVAHAEERAAEPASSGYVIPPPPGGWTGNERLASYVGQPVVYGVDLASGADTSIETTEADAKPLSAQQVSALLDQVVPTEETALLREALQFVEHISGPFSGKFPTHPKPDGAWWGKTRQYVDDLLPRLQAACGVASSEVA